MNIVSLWYFLELHHHFFIHDELGYQKLFTFLKCPEWKQGAAFLTSLSVVYFLWVMTVWHCARLLSHTQGLSLPTQHCVTHAKTWKGVFPPQREWSVMICVTLVWHKMPRWLMRDTQGSDWRASYREKNLEAILCQQAHERSWQFFLNVLEQSQPSLETKY